MIFTESAFVYFITAFLALHFVTIRHWRVNRYILLVASYFFYGWADWRFLFLLLGSSLADFSLALIINGARDEVWRKRSLIFSVFVNLLFLAAFKYYDFFATSFHQLAVRLGFSSPLPILNVVLPAGISFYTFQSMSYTIDVYRRHMKPTSSLPAYLLYVSFFPQLVAGPIERAAHLLPQIERPPRFDFTMAAHGCRQILAGFFMKVVIADNLAALVDRVFAAPQNYDAPVLLAATALFGWQIYFDFAGYSNIAIGLGKILGVDIIQNFKTPYFATSIQDFWRRWHISLSTFFRDYLFYPSGGSRRGAGRTVLNLYIVFLLSGLWHGANWTFLLWGFYHATGYTASRCLELIVPRTRLAGSSAIRPAAWVLTQGFVMIGWVFFRAQSLPDALGILSTILSPARYSLRQIEVVAPHAWIVALTLAFFLLEFLQRRKTHVLQIDDVGSAPLRAAIYLAFLLAIFLLGAGTQAQFIYFRF